MIKPLFNQSDIIVNGIKLHYTRTGDGNQPAVMLAHGFSDSGMCWLPAAQELSMEYDVILPDARGHGQSERIKEGVQLDMVGDLAGLIDGLGLKGLVLGGHSMGASVSATVGATHPGLMRALILEDPAWFMPKPAETQSEPPRPNTYSTWLMSLSDQTVEVVMAKCHEDNPTWAEIELRPWAESKLAFDPNFIGIRGLADMSWRDVARAIQCPTLLITAEPSQGAIVSPEAAALASSLNPKIQVVKIEGAGHNIRREAYSAYIAAVKDFLKGL